jgi:type VI secretion system secreted protein VgrG
VNLNSGGSAGSGSGFGGAAAALPGELAAVAPPEEAAKLNIQALKVAEESHYAAVKTCPYAKEN